MRARTFLGERAAATGAGLCRVHESVAVAMAACVALAVAVPGNDRSRDLKAVPSFRDGGEDHP